MCIRDRYKDAGTADSSTIADLQAEIARLKVFEDNAQYYQDLKDKFDREVVYTDNAPDISNYKSVSYTHLGTCNV